MSTWLDLLGLKRDSGTGMVRCDGCSKPKPKLTYKRGKFLCPTCSRKKQS